MLRCSIHPPITTGMHDLMTEWNTEVGAWCSKQIKTLQKAGAR